MALSLHYSRCIIAGSTKKLVGMRRGSDFTSRNPAEPGKALIPGLVITGIHIGMIAE
jgi:hypothetical protein